MFDCIKEGTLECVRDIQGMLGHHCGVAIPAFSLIGFLKAVWHGLFALAYVLFAASVSVSFIILTAGLLGAYNVHLLLGLPILILSFIPTTVSGIWFVNIWYACQNRNS